MGTTQICKDFVFPKLRSNFLQPTLIAWGECYFEDLTCSFCPELTHQGVNTRKAKRPVVIFISHAKENLETFVLPWNKPWCCLNTSACETHRKWSYFGFWEYSKSSLFNAAWEGWSLTYSQMGQTPEPSSLGSLITSAINLDYILYLDLINVLSF